MELFDKAVKFATDAHGIQQRKNSGHPYIVHPLRVALYVQRYGGTIDEICAAVLHDVLEDCMPDNERILGLNIRNDFGQGVRSIVGELTSEEPRILGIGQKRPPRKDRKLSEARRLSKCSDSAKLIKMADRYDNLMDLSIEQGYKYIRLYAEESQQLVDHIAPTTHSLQVHSIIRELLQPRIYEVLDLAKSLQYGPDEAKL